MKNHIETTFVDADGDSQTLQQILNIMQELKCNNEQIKKQAEIVIYKMWLKDVLLKWNGASLNGSSNGVFQK